MQSDKVEMIKLIFVIKVHNIFVTSPVDCYLHITCDCILKHVFYICTACIVSIVEPSLHVNGIIMWLCFMQLLIITSLFVCLNYMLYSMRCEFD